MAVTKKNIELAIELAKSYGAKKFVLFGSTLDSPESVNDLDLVVDGIVGFEIFSYGEQLEM